MASEYFRYFFFSDDLFFFFQDPRIKKDSKETNKNIIEHQMVQHENNGISNKATLTLNS